MSILPIMAQDAPQGLVGEALLNHLALQIARTERQLSPPEVILENNQQGTARYVPGVRPRIYFSQRLYAICQSFGKDSTHAMAALIGHELAHHFERHKLMQPFAGVGERQHGATEEQVKLESDADYLGLTMALLAGYTEAPRLLPHLLDKIYQIYRLPDQLPGYPSKAQRIQITQKRMEELYPLRYTYLAGQVLLLTGEFGHAALCFESVARQLNSREVVNNLSVAKLEWALTGLPLCRKAYVFPFEVDPEGRIAKGTLRASDHAAIPVESLLDEAATRFQEAKLVDPGYVPAYINLACTRILQGNPNAALGEIGELSRRMGQAQRQLPANALLVKAIALAENRQYGPAAVAFEEATAREAFQASYNQQLFAMIRERGKESYEQQDEAVFAQFYENWKSQYFQQHTERAAFSFTPRESALGDWQLDALPPLKKGEHITGTQPMFFHYHPQPEREAVQVTLNDRELLLLMANPSFGGTTGKGVGVGTWQKVVREKYGRPDKTHAGAGGMTYWAYQMPGLIFQFQDQTVQGWMVYQYTFH